MYGIQTIWDKKLFSGSATANERWSDTQVPGWLGLKVWVLTADSERMPDAGEMLLSLNS